MNDAELKTLLETAKTIAVVGCSDTQGKAAHDIPKRLQRAGYKIIPVNPTHDTVLGEKAYKSLKDVSERVDIVDVFRPSEETPEIVREAVNLKLKPKLVFLQLGIENDESKKIASEAGIPIIMNACLGVKYNQLMT